MRLIQIDALPHHGRQATSPLTMSIHTDIEDLVEEFDFLGDWEERYAYLIDMGKALDGLDENQKTEDTRVKGCVSQVWLVHETTPDNHILFHADSDAHIVRGLAALMVRIYSNRTAQEILSVDAKAVLERIGLSEHLSPQRSNGLVSMMNRIRRVAESAA